MTGSCLSSEAEDKSASQRPLQLVVVSRSLRNIPDHQAPALSVFPPRAHAASPADRGTIPSEIPVPPLSKSSPPICARLPSRHLPSDCRPARCEPASSSASVAHRPVSAHKTASRESCLRDARPEIPRQLTSPYRRTVHLLGRQSKPALRAAKVASRAAAPSHSAKYSQDFLPAPKLPSVEPPSTAQAFR